ncbi:1,2-dihydroxy-3-keto-5-methylthiopentene dioxygenase [Stagnimonas aquatica]|uniref:1,2-dihydroxy-3-keto-5-methylthiopentene dioxygenase n=1 Tax=Stagnimonas aquatica TaxID=2689987 RepID=UPI001F2FD935|nr:cupin [Stagnimonas aquatica]
MTTLTITPDHRPDQVLLHSSDFATIQRELAAVGVPMERWRADAQLAPDADPATVLKAYEGSVAALNAKYGFQSVDVVSMHPEHEQAQAARGKFLAEHTHADFEIRFFVDGAGVFYIRTGGKVYQILCTAGDLIEVPADTTHWFDMGPKPLFKAIRFFTRPDGWVGNFTGDPIAKSFPEYAGAGV